MLILLLFCCHQDPVAAIAPMQVPKLRFHAAAERKSADGAVLATAKLGDSPVPFDWHVLMREGTTYGGLPYGTVVDRLGQPMVDKGGATCSSPDFNGLFEAFGAIWLISHLECAPAGLWLSRLERVAGASFTVSNAAPIDLAPVGGSNNLCAGQMTPWGTALSGEEYESNVLAIGADGIPLDPLPGLVDGKHFVDYSKYPETIRYMAGQPHSPYGNGWMLETRLVDATGATALVKHGAMGRFSHEVGLVLPDQRTVYLTDDQSHAIFAMFVADRAADLSAGTLYAARWAGTEADMRLTWVSLGHATDAEVGAARAAGVQFDDLFEHQLVENGACPEGYTAHRSPQYIDACLRVKPGQELLASRLETRRFAGLLGATTELHKSEGLAYDAEAGLLYMATTRISGGMLAGEPPFPGRDHLALTENPCGAIWSFDLVAGAKDTTGAPIDSALVASVGRINIAGVAKDNGCAPESISEPDNISFITGHGVLLIGEDTDRAPNKLWAWQDGALLPLFAAPGFPDHPGEVTGLQWFPAVGGAAWITLSVQRPGGQPAMSGVLGPFPLEATRP